MATNGGGSPITDYTIEYSGDGGSNWLTYSDGTSTDALVTVSGLSDDTTYLFRVSAVNAVGTGSASDMASATTAAVPGLPTGFTAAATYVTDYSVDLSWTAPDDKRVDRHQLHDRICGNRRVELLGRYMTAT